jgi:hypothetical protein
LVDDIPNLKARNIRPGTICYGDIDLFLLRNPDNPDRDILKVVVLQLVMGEIVVQQVLILQVVVEEVVIFRIVVGEVVVLQLVVREIVVQQVVMLQVMEDVAHR